MIQKFLPRFLGAMLSFFVVFNLCGCSLSHKNSTVHKRMKIAAANKIAKKHGFTMELVNTKDFVVTTYQKISDPSKDYVFYIEGDGEVSKYGFPSEDPTPRKPMAFKMATMDDRENIVYISRPCQYTPMELNPKCNKSYWTDKRWSEDSVDCINDVINSISPRKRAIHLVGFSGGGGMSILIANKNKMVKDIVTVGANLNIDLFTKYHKSNAFIKSLNPINYAANVNNIPQLHLAGSLDRIVPPFIIDSFVKKSNSNCVRQKTILDLTHTSDGWVNNWKDFLTIPVECVK